MNAKLETKLVKYSLIGLPVAFFAFLAVEAVGIAPWIEKDDFRTKSFDVESRFGKVSLTEFRQGSEYSDPQTYFDSKLNFKITKPNDYWKFDKNLDDILQKSGNKLYANGFLGGIYVTNNNEKVFLITVFDLSNQNDFELDRYISSQINELESRFDGNVPIKFVSEDKNWALIGMQVDENNRSHYGEQLLHYHDGILYMLQYQGMQPGQIDKSQQEEIRSIIDSFETI